MTLMLMLLLLVVVDWLFDCLFDYRESAWYSGSVSAGVSTASGFTGTVSASCKNLARKADHAKSRSTQRSTSTPGKCDRRSKSAARKPWTQALKSSNGMFRKSSVGMPWSDDAMHTIKVLCHSKMICHSLIPSEWKRGKQTDKLLMPACRETFCPVDTKTILGQQLLHQNLLARKALSLEMQAWHHLKQNTLKPTFWL